MSQFRLRSKPLWACVCSVLDPQDSIKELLNCILRAVGEENGGPMWTAAYLQQKTATLTGLTTLTACRAFAGVSVDSRTEVGQFGTKEGGLKWGLLPLALSVTSPKAKLWLISNDCHSHSEINAVWTRTTDNCIPTTLPA